MEGTKYDDGKAAWDLIPPEYFIRMAVSIRPFIEMHLIKDGKFVFDKGRLLNVARTDIMRWWHMGECSPLGRMHPLTEAMIALCMLAKPRTYTIEELNASDLGQRWDLIDHEWTTNIAEIYAFGAAKYEHSNWQKVSAHRYFSALNRHIDHYLKGDIFDSESGYRSLYHSAWNCIALQWHEDDKKRVQIPSSIIKASKKLKNVSLAVKPAKVKKK